MSLSTLINTSSNNNTNTNKSSNNTSSQACAACKYQRRKCAADCMLAPYFPYDRQRQFLNAHRLFGVSNITKIIKNLHDPKAKDDAMRTIIFQSDVRASDPVGGCFRIVRDLQRQIDFAKAELDALTHNLSLLRAAAAASSADCHFLDHDAADDDHHHDDVTSWVVSNESDIKPNLQQQPMIMSHGHAHAHAHDDCLDVKPTHFAAAYHHPPPPPPPRDGEDESMVLKEENYAMQAEHDLRDAATFFTLTNCTT